MNGTDARIWLSNWFVQNSDADISFIEENAERNYFELGLVDSMKFISLVSDAEREFKISFSNDEFQDRTFSTMEGLSKIITAKASR